MLLKTINKSCYYENCSETKGVSANVTIKVVGSCLVGQEPQQAQRWQHWQQAVADFLVSHKIIVQEALELVRNRLREQQQ